MKHFYLKTLFLLAFLMAGLTVSAYDCEVDGICYDLSENEASVVYRVNPDKRDNNQSGDYSGDIVIPSVITFQDKSYNVTTIEWLAFYGCTELTSITLPDNLKRINERAFYNCQKLTSITIPSNVELLQDKVFMGCINLKTVTINSNEIVSKNRGENWSLKDVFGDQVTQYILGENTQSIGDCLFCYCDKLEAITFSDNATTIGREAFYGCSSLKHANLPEKLTTIGSHAFNGCNNLLDVTIHEEVSTIEYGAFAGCNNLNTVTINSNAIVSSTKRNEGLKEIFGNQVTNYILGNNVTTIGEYAFYNCNNLKSITIPGSVKYVKDRAFYGCSSLNKVIVPDISAWVGISFENNSNPLTVAHHLYNDEDTEITDLIIPEGIETIGDNAFYYCSGLNSITIPSSLKTIGKGAFTLCEIEKVVVSDLTSYCGITFGCEIGSRQGSRLFNDENTEIVDLIIPEGITSISGNAFYGFKNIKSVSIPGSLTTIGGCAFSFCEGLTKVIVPDITAWCSISFDGYESNPLYWAQYLYSDNNTEITELEIPNQTERIEGYAFYNASFLTKVRISDGVKAIGTSAFAGCKKMVSLIIPSSLNSIDWWAFSGCENLVKVVIPDLAAWCAISLNKYNNPLSTSHHLYSDEDTEIKLLEIPDGVTSISQYAFYGCGSINSIILPRTVTSFGEHAFSGCNGVTSIWSKIIAPYDIPDNVFEYKDESGKTDGYLHATLYVPTGTKDRYETTNGWKNFKYIEEYDPTGILHLTADKKKYLNSIFDLNGQHLTTPQKGINIINGQKVIVK